MKQFFKVALLLPSLLLAVAVKSRAACRTPDKENEKQLINYVAAKFHLPNDSLTISQAEQANESCFWKLKFTTVAAPARSIVLYLSPDGKYLVPDLLDTQVDPRVAERQKAIDTNKQLAGAVSPNKGPQNAEVTITEFSDFECPYCQRLAETLNAVYAAEPTKIRIVFKPFPLGIHPWAKQGAKLALCASMQGSDNFWKLHDFYFTNQKLINKDNIDSLSMALLGGANGKVDAARMNQCVTSKEVATQLDEDIKLGTSLGVQSTPTFFVNGERYSGAKSEQELKVLISSAEAEKSINAVASDTHPQTKVLK